MFHISAATPTYIPTSLAATQLPFTALQQQIPTAFPQATMTPIPQRPAYYPPIIYWYPSPPISPQTIVSHTEPLPVIMRGLPINTTVQDILNFFRGFPEVRLRYKREILNSDFDTRQKLKIYISNISNEFQRNVHGIVNYTYLLYEINIEIAIYVINYLRRLAHRTSVMTGDNLDALYVLGLVRTLTIV